MIDLLSKITMVLINNFKNNRFISKKDFHSNIASFSR
jgi:hypothetical protein